MPMRLAVCVSGRGSNLLALLGRLGRLGPGGSGPGAEQRAGCACPGTGPGSRHPGGEPDRLPATERSGSAACPQAQVDLDCARRIPEAGAGRGHRGLPRSDHQHSSGAAARIRRPRHVRPPCARGGAPERGRRCRAQRSTWWTSTTIGARSWPRRGSRCMPGDTPETLAARVLQAEHRLLPAVVLRGRRGRPPCSPAQPRSCTVRMPSCRVR